MERTIRDGGAVLVVRLGSLGDVVLSFAAVSALARGRSDLAIHYLVKEEFADLVRRQPWAERVWILPSGPVRKSGELARLRGELLRFGFDASVDLQTNTRSAYLTRGHRNLHRWNAARWQRRRWVSLKWTRPEPVLPAWRRFVQAVEPLGAAVAEPPEVHWKPEDEREARDFFASWDREAGASRPMTAFAPGARWASKRWPEESFLALGVEIVRRGDRVLLAGSREDRAQLPRLSGWAASSPHARWFEGSLPALAAALARARRALTNDTGLLHLAAAVGTPVAAIYGSTHPALGFPPAGEGHAILCLELSCQPCTLHGRPGCPLGHHRCVRDLEPERVLAALEALPAREESPGREPRWAREAPRETTVGAGGTRVPRTRVPD